MATISANGVSPALLLDIFSLVMQFCDLPTISCLMRTCSTLYGCGSTPLLHQEFFLESQDAVISFCLFMGAGDGTRYSALRSLSLDLESKVVPIHLGRQIQCLLNHLTALEELIIYGLDDLLDVHPPLVDSIAALATVKDIYLWGCRHRALKDLIPQLHSPLAHISIGFRPKDRFTFLESLSDRELLDYHPVRMFSRFAATLERLDTDYGASALDNRIESPAIYPLVRSLSLCDGWPTMRPWIDAFPALRRLVNLSREGKRRIDGRRTRRMNMNDQLSNGSWAALKKCSGTAFGLYVLGLICPVERVAVKGVSTNEHTQMFFDVLAIARPAYLSLEVKDKRLLQDAAKEGISYTFRRRSARFMFIRTLKIKFHAEVEDRVRTSFNILSLMTGDVIHALLHLALTHLKLVVYLDWHDDQPQPTEHQMARLQDACDVCAQRAIASIHSLAHATVTVIILGHEWIVSQADR